MQVIPALEICFRNRKQICNQRFSTHEIQSSFCKQAVVRGTLLKNSTFSDNYEITRFLNLWLLIESISFAKSLFLWPLYWPYLTSKYNICFIQHFSKSTIPLKFILKLSRIDKKVHILEFKYSASYLVMLY